MKRQTKTEIGVGSVVKAKVGELENITREGRAGLGVKVWLDVSILWWGRRISYSNSNMGRRKR